MFFDEQNLHSIDGDGELMLSILASFAQEESLSVSENCKWRIRKNFAEGKLASLRLYGYEFIHGKPVIRPPEAETVRSIFSDFLAGMSMGEIGRSLTARGVPTVYGGAWSGVTIAYILRNEKYAGDMLLQKTYIKDHLSKAKKTNRGELPMFYVRNTHEAIIGREEFDAAQAELSRRKAKYAPETKHPMISEFTGKIRCGKCGAQFFRKITPHNTLWACATYQAKGRKGCDIKRIPESILKGIAADVLELDAYDASVFSSLIETIEVPENGVLVFLFKDGRSVVRTWENRSRSESWTEDMRMRARERMLSRKDVRHEP